MEAQKAGETDGQTNDNSFIDPHSAAHTGVLCKDHPS